MDIEFCDKRLALIRTDRAAEARLPISVIKSCREKLIVIAAAPDARTLRNWKSLGYEELKGIRSGQHSIRLNDQSRLIFELDENRSPSAVFVVAVDDYH